MSSKSQPHKESNETFDRKVDIVLLGRVENTALLKKELTKRGYSVALLSGSEPSSYAATLISNATSCIVTCGVTGAFLQKETVLAVMKAKDKVPSIFIPDIPGINEIATIQIADKIENCLRI